MTNITGKIYQETNDDGTENRFPKTVVPAVIGLSQYLQDQFNTLSDLYMPKEGESESKTGQEIIYRKSEATINAKTVTIDRIKGKSVRYNQLIDILPGERYGLTITENGYGGLNISGTVGTAPTYGQGIISSTLTFRRDGSKYLLRFKNNKNYEIGLTGYGSWSSSLIWSAEASNDWSGSLFIRISDGLEVSVQNLYINVINLTDLYGRGHEPSTVAEFEEDYPEFILETTNKGLLVNATKKLVTSNNLWNRQVTEINSYISGDGGGINGGAADHFVSSYIEVIPGKSYSVVNNYHPLGNMAGIAYYNSNKQVISASRYSQANYFTSTAPSGAKYCRFSMCPSPLVFENFLFKEEDGISLNNLSESKINLNLGSFKIKSQNIWDEAWENGELNAQGQPIAENTKIRSKNYCKLVPGTSYYFKGFAYLCFYDANYNFISSTQPNNSTFTAPSNAHYFKFNCARDYGSTYGNNICINVSSSFNGQYEPYGEITITGGLKSAGNTFDEIYKNKYIKRVGEVDMGDDISWAVKSGYEHVFYSWTLNTAGKIASGANVLSDRYPTGTEYEVYNPPFSVDPGICFGNSGFIGLCDSRLAADGINNALRGIKLYYTLKTPIEYELATPLNFTLPVKGAEYSTPISSTGISCPFCCDLTYNASETAGVLDALQGLSRKLELIEERLARLEDNE